LDIKDFILVAGGILITLVIGHGFWIALRAKREPLRMDIVPDRIPDYVDEMERLRGELPNGGARIVKGRGVVDDAGQQNLELDLAAPVLDDAAEPAAKETQPPSPHEAEASEQESSTSQAPHKAPFDRPKKLRARVHQTAGAASDTAPAPQPTPIVSDAEPLVADRPKVQEVELEPQSLHSEQRKPANSKPQGFKNQGLKRQMQKQKQKQREQVQPEPPAVEELLVINVLAPKGQRFDGEGLVAALRSQGLRYGDMNIFHRVDPATKAKLYSVANAVEPGTFDLSDLSTMQSPGMTFFLQLPGPDDAGAMFDDMLQAARNVALDLGGELRDEDLSVLTGQSTEHMRQRIADFARRRLSKRA